MDKPQTVDEYLKSLSEDRREALTKIRTVILENLPDGYKESFRWNMITYEIPLETYPDTYNDQPLSLASIASQKNHMAVYLIPVYSDPAMEKEFKEKYLATGKKLDMGKSCVRFKSLSDLPLDLIGETIAKFPVERMIKIYEAVRK